jgi:hypothetical protein
VADSDALLLWLWLTRPFINALEYDSGVGFLLLLLLLGVRGSGLDKLYCVVVDDGGFVDAAAAAAAALFAWEG